MAKNNKTNVMRILDQKKIKYQGLPWSEVGTSHVPMYKTLVTVGKSGENYVFIVSKESELDLKKAATAVDEKNIHLIKEKELLPLTGYVHGGCSPIGMKKEFKTLMDQSALDFEEVLVSAGQVEWSVQLNPQDLMSVVRGRFADLQSN